MDRIQKIHFIRVIILAGFLLSGLIHYVQGYYGGAGYPYNTFLYAPDARFFDFFMPYRIANNPYQQINPHLLPNFPFIAKDSGIIDGELFAASRGGPLYFPLAYWFVSLFTLVPQVQGLILFWIISLSLFCVVASRKLLETSRAGTVTNLLLFTLASYPFLMAMDRANFEIFLFLFLFVFISCYQSRPAVALATLVCAAAMKGYPAVFFLLYIADKRFKEALWGGALAVGLTMIGYSTYPGGLASNLVNHLVNLNLSGRVYGEVNAGMIFGHSLFGASKYLFYWLTSANSAAGIPGSMQSLVMLASLVAIALLALDLIVVKKAFWKQVFVLVSIACLFPTVSADYKLLLIYLPLYLFIESEPTPGDRLPAVLLALLLIPKDYARLASIPEANLGVLLNPLIIILLLAWIFFTGLRSERLFVLRDTTNQFFNAILRFAARPKLWLPQTAVLTGCAIALIDPFLAYQNIMRAPSPDPALLAAVMDKSAQEGRWEIEAAYAQQWAATQPGAVGPYLRLSQNYVAQARFYTGFRKIDLLDKAANLYELVLDNPQLSQQDKVRELKELQQTLVSKGLVYLETGQYQLAYEELQSLLDRYPDLPAALKGMVKLYSQMGARASAVEWFTALNKVEPQDAQILMTEARALETLGEKLPAALKYETAAIADPKLLDALIKAKNIYFDEKSPSDCSRVDLLLGKSKSFINQ